MPALREVNNINRGHPWRTAIVKCHLPVMILPIGTVWLLTLLKIRPTPTSPQLAKQVLFPLKPTSPGTLTNHLNSRTKVLQEVSRPDLPAPAQYQDHHPLADLCLDHLCSLSRSLVRTIRRPTCPNNHTPVPKAITAALRQSLLSRSSTFIGMPRLNLLPRAV